MSQWRMIVLAFVFVCLSTAGHAESKYFAGDATHSLPNRMAMLVGVPSYTGLWAGLDNVRRDVPAVKDALATTGFDNIRVVDDTKPEDGRVTRALIFEHLYAFMEEARAQPGSVLVFYFAGHGFTHRGKMYLVPADASIKYAEDPERFAIPLTDIIDVIKAAKPLVALVVVDACRDLPFSELSSFGEPGIQSVRAGGFVDPRSLTYEDNQPNIGIVYSASTGEKALDGPQNGTSHFVTALVGAIRDGVDKASSGADGTPMTVNARDIADDIVIRVQQLTSNPTPRQNPRPELPFGYRLPLFSTERAFNAEQKAWRELVQATDLGTLSRIYEKLDLKTAQEKIYCLRFGFLRTWGYSYFWKEASKLVDAVRTDEAVKQCLAATSAVAAAAPGLAGPNVLAPSGQVSDRLASGSAPAAPSTTELRPAPQLPVTPLPVPSASDRSLMTDALQANAKVLLTAAVMFDQPTYPGGRKVPLQAGEGVTFIHFIDPAHKTAKVFHDKHGFGNVPVSALASRDAVIRVAFSYDPGQIDLSPDQQQVLDTQITQTNPIKAISATIRYPQADRTLGFRRAQAIVGYLRATAPLPADRAADFVIPTIIEADIERGLVSLAIGVQTDATPVPAADVTQPQAPPTQTIAVGVPTAASANPIAVRVIDLQPTKK